MQFLKIANYIRSIIFLPATVTLFILYSLGAPFLTISTKNIKQAYIRVARVWAQHLLRLAGITVTAEGLENVPMDQTCIFVSNHQSMIDIFICFGYIPKYIGFFAKKSLFSIPYYGWILKISGSIPIDRSDAKKDFSTLESAAQKIKQGQDLIIYPEGTRSGKPQLNSFKRGCVVLASKSQAVIIPTAIKDSYKAVRKGSIQVYPAHLSISFGKPVKVPENSTRKQHMVIVKKLENEISDMLRR
ncbi:MAG: hypothetical protein DKM50_12865 [Candidatus Margulisiibacteriota bacterium]|nr:MAG: hypothetical protein A2X43_07280 [Candidatus Margulisbacteria bacterium GWD2_39_127]OGI03775.1 MAG: hypothetical protein A2X42_13090 [Candidatus Margulisbacteria bacterium GWF2_38_17]OGI05831.1 MAG: hypothetical protein A2X41_02840 [Candidatus Margulisbacteria bacterium GWE2_39_32]PZM77426.1 MAG: hypothetical protein DKM50_12865 [Candidatus Margulisiibacteriota bacterium]HAR64107.1 hypothetical protein [Candidatus Margulisiibacteriota bacterium]